jgi:hypothetical protein
MLSVGFYCYAERRNAKCSVFIVMLSVIRLNVVVLSVVALMPATILCYIISGIYISEVFCETANNSDCEFTCLAHLGNARKMEAILWMGQGILKGEVSLYR